MIRGKSALGRMRMNLKHWRRLPERNMWGSHRCRDKAVPAAHRILQWRVRKTLARHQCDRPTKEDAMNWIQVGKLEDIRAGPWVVNTPRARSRCFAVWMIRCSRWKTAVRTKAGHCPRASCTAALTCPMHSWVIELETGNAVAPDTWCARRMECRLHGVCFGRDRGLRIE